MKLSASLAGVCLLLSLAASVIAAQVPAGGKPEIVVVYWSSDD